MNTRNKTFQIFLNNQELDMYTDADTIRMNNNILDIGKLNQKKNIEYSYSFSLPATKKNNRIFGDINIPCSKNKFIRKYDCEVIVDNITIYNGNILLTEFNNEKGEYKCNLVTGKRNNLDELFGDKLLNELKWEVDFNGTPTINQINNDKDSKYFYPMVAYNLFQKEANNITMSGYRQYTPKDVIDKTNRFYWNSFVPSLNLMEILKRSALTVNKHLSGTAVGDPVLNEIYLSNNISSEQNPAYNIGGKRGELDILFNFTNKIVTEGSGDGHSGHVKLTSIANNTEYMLTNIPSYPDIKPESQNNLENYDSCFVFSPLKKNQGRRTFNNVTVTSDVGEMFDRETGIINIQTGGWYEITLGGEMSVPAQEMFRATQCVSKSYGTGSNTTKTYEMKDITINPEQTPLEIQLLQYSPEDNGDEENISHELSYFGWYPNESEAYSKVETWADDNILPHYTNKKYLNQTEKTITAVDPANNNNYIIGAEFYNKNAGIGYRKNGYSWKTTDYNESLYNCPGYYYVEYSLNNSDYNKNTLLNTTDYISYDEKNVKMTFTAHTIVKLNKATLLQLFFQTRAYYDDKNVKQFYKANINNCHLTIRAVAPEKTNKAKLLYGMKSLFSEKLQLQNFINDETKTKDFFNNVAKAFNLTLYYDENNIYLDKNKIDDNISVLVNIDNKCTIDDASFKNSDLPEYVEMKWSIDKEEEGYYFSAINNSTEDDVNNDTFLDNANVGSEKIKISNTTNKPVTETSQFSYNWYKDFDIYDYKEWKKRYINTPYPDNKYIEEKFSYIALPVIGKHSWWIEGRNYQEDAKKDGRSFKQRFWFRNTPTNLYLPVNRTPETATENNLVQVTTGTSYKVINGDYVFLSYDSGNTLLKHFFNVNYKANDEVEVECYLTSEEYSLLKKYARVKLNDDIYICTNISGYDVTGKNPTKLNLIK